MRRDAWVGMRIAPLLFAMRSSNGLVSFVGLAFLCACYAQHARVDVAMSDASVHDAATDACALPDGNELDPTSVVQLPVLVTQRLERADVAFLIDTTSSMGAEIDRIQRTLSDVIAPGIRNAVPDVQFAVATFEDYPTSPYGGPGDLPLTVVQTMTPDLDVVQRALDGVELGFGGDYPEAQTQALYEVASGDFDASVLEPPVCPAGTFGGVCFRDSSAALVFLFTDAPFHNGRGGTNPYEGGGGEGTYAEMIRSVREHGVHVVSFWSGPEFGTPQDQDDARFVAYESGSVTSDMQTMIYSIGENGEDLDARVIEAIQTFADRVGLDVTATAIDPDPSDGFDPRSIVESIEPLRAIPSDGVAGISRETNTFRRVVSGTQVVFALTLNPDVRIRRDVEQRYQLDVVYRADGRIDLSTQHLTVVIPARSTCAPAHLE